MRVPCHSCLNEYDNTVYHACPHCAEFYNKPIPIIDEHLVNIQSTLDNKQHKLDALYMDIAERISQMSHAKRRKVGAVLVKDNNIIAFGWNGMPAGYDNCCELDDGSTDPRTIHAEINLFSKIASSSGNSNGSTLYLTLSPCYDCCKLIIQSGIKRVVYKEVYRISEPIEFLKEACIETYKLPR